MKRFHTLICLLLVVFCCLGCLTACGGKTAGDTSSTATDATSGTHSGEAEKEAFPYPEYYENTTLKILTVDSARHTYGELQFQPDSESNFTAISEAVRARNDLIEEKYGLKIELYAEQYPITQLRTLIQANQAEYDLVCDSVDYMVQSVTENFFWSVDDLLDLKKAWWDQEAMDAISIGGKHYFLSGDALLTDDDNTYLYLFNKDMYQNNTNLTGRYGNIYELVRSGGFTLDVFEEMCREVSHADTDGMWGFHATYGNLSHAYGATVLMNGCNFATASPDETGMFRLNVGTQLGYSLFDKVYSIMSNKQMTQRAELIAGEGATPSKYGFSELQEMFTSGRGLFYNTTSSSISILKSQSGSMDFEFGVLPIPKYDAQQETYCCTVNRYQSAVLGVPVTNTDNLEATAVLLQALGYYSADVKKSYYQQTLQLQALTDNDDAEMLDLVYSHRFYDLGAMFAWGNNALIGFYGGVIADDTTNAVVSSWERISSAVESDMKATIDAYQNALT